MYSPDIAGAIIVGLPAVIIAYLALWRKNRPVFWFALALVAVGLGYLATTNTPMVIARSLFGQQY